LNEDAISGSHQSITRQKKCTNHETRILESRILASLFGYLPFSEFPKKIDSKTKSTGMSHFQGSTAYFHTTSERRNSFIDISPILFLNKILTNQSLERFYDMLITERKFGIYKIVNIFFAEKPVTYSLPDCDVIIYHTYKNWENVEGFERIHYPTTTMDLSQGIEDIWNKFHRQHRRHIRRAEKNGTKVSVSDKFEEFHRIYKKFLKQKNYADRFGLNIPSSKFMQKYGTLLIAENHGEILTGNLYFHDGENALLVNGAYKIFGNNIDNYKLSADASCYLDWVAMQYFKNLGVINYDLGGLKEGELKLHHKMPGLNYYKLSFGGDIITQYEFQKFNSRFNNLLFRSWEFLRSFQ